MTHANRPDPAAVVRADTIRGDTIGGDTVRADSVQRGVVHADDQTDVGRADPGRAASLRADGDRAEVVREAITLPLIFLTVALGGGFRQARDTGQLIFLAPSLMALVLALLLIGVLFRAGVLVPDRLMHASRTPLANLSGSVVLASLFAAAAQLFNTVTPEAGLLQFVSNLFFLLLLWNTIAARPDRRRLLHSLLVLFGGAFVLKYVVLGALYDPQGGLTKRVLTTLLEGVTLGGLTYQSPAALTGYVAFFTILLFLIGLILLPQDPGPGQAPGSSRSSRSSESSRSGAMARTDDRSR